MEALFSGQFDSSKYKPRWNNLPRVLLRGWHPGTAAAALGLNTDRGIYPFAWQYLLPAFNGGVSPEPNVMPPRLTDLSRGEVLALASVHIEGDIDVASHFSSWSADLPTAVFFAMGSYRVQGWEMHEPGQIAVVDLSRPYPIIHVPDLGLPNLPMEYLVHGPVTQGLRVVSIAAIRNTLRCMLWPFCYSARREPHSITEEEISESIFFGLLFQSAADKHIDVALVLAASLLSWGQVPVSSPRPLGEADLLRAERQQTRPWPPADLERILGSRLLVHNGVGPPLSGAVLANPLTSTETWGPTSDTAAGTSKPRLTREQWEAAFRAAASQHAPNTHVCGQFRCRFCGKTRAGATATDFSRPESIYFCTRRCLNSQTRKESVEREGEFP